jgi:heptosyltransferase II
VLASSPNQGRRRPGSQDSNNLFFDRQPGRNFMRIGVFLPNWIGDVVMATPALRALAKHVARQGQLVGIMRPYVAEVLEGTSWLDETILYTKNAKPWGSGRDGAAQQIRAARLDQVVLFTNSFRTAWIAWRSGARERVGYARDIRSWLLTQRLAPLRSAAGGGLAGRGRKAVAVPPIDAYLHLVKSIGCPPESPRLELATTPADERMADAVWSRLDLPPGEQVVVLNSGGAYGAAKHWPAEHFAALAQQIVADGPSTVLINCGPAEREIAAEIVDRAAHRRVVGLAGVEHLPIGLTKACLRRSRMLVTTDSGPRFIGIAFGKPVVTLFGPTNPAATITHYEGETSLSLSLDCQPCMERVCPLAHHRCMKDLTVERVYAAVARHLARPAAGLGAA